MMKFKRFTAPSFDLIKKKLVTIRNSREMINIKFNYFK